MVLKMIVAMMKKTMKMIMLMIKKWKIVIKMRR